MTSRSTAGVLIAVGLLAATSPARAQRGPAPRRAPISARRAVAGLLAQRRARAAGRCRCASPAARTRSSGASTRPATWSRSTPARNNGIEVGQEFYVRRLQVDAPRADHPRHAGHDPHHRLDSGLRGGRRDVAGHDHARLRHDRGRRLPRAVRAARRSRRSSTGSSEAGARQLRPRAGRRRPPHAASARATTS